MSSSLRQSYDDAMEEEMDKFYAKNSLENIDEEEDEDERYAEYEKDELDRHLGKEPKRKPLKMKRFQI